MEGPLKVAELLLHMKYLQKYLETIYKGRTTLFEKRNRIRRHKICPSANHLLSVYSLNTRALNSTSEKQNTLTCDQDSTRKHLHRIVLLCLCLLLSLLLSSPSFCFVSLYTIFFLSFSFIFPILELITMDFSHLITIISKYYLGKFLTQWPLSIGY